MVIFNTAYSEFAVKGFNLNAVNYLLKPFTPEKFLHQHTLVKVALADIIFIEGLDDYLKIHLSGQKPLVSRMTMKAMM